MKVLYFDDEPFIAKALVEHLRILYERDVTLVFEINDLFEELESNHYDIIVLDIMAPIPPFDNHFVRFTKNEIKEMDGGLSTGIVLARKIWESYERISLLFFSARSRPEAIAKFQKEGRQCEYLRKPELAKTVNEALNQLTKTNSDEK